MVAVSGSCRQLERASPEIFVVLSLRFSSFSVCCHFTHFDLSFWSLKLVFASNPPPFALSQSWPLALVHLAKMRLLRRFGPTIAVTAVLIVLSVLALLTFGESFKFYISRENGIFFKKRDDFTTSVSPLWE
jgi:hypothetical protein